MRYISEIIGKPLISLYEGEKLGIITDIYTNKNYTRLAWLIVEYSFETLQIKKAVKLNSVYSIGLDAVMVYNKDKVCDISFAAQAKKVLDSDVFTIDGELVGKVKDIKIENNEIKSFILDNGKETDNKKLLSSLGDTLILFKDKKIKIPSPKLDKIDEKDKRLYKQSNNTKNIVYMPIESVDGFKNNNDERLESEISNDTPNDNKPTDTALLCDYPNPSKIEQNIAINTLPPKILSDFTFLIGRKTTADIYNKAKLKIIKANSLITANIVDIARKNHMLIELTRCSKK